MEIDSRRHGKEAAEVDRWKGHRCPGSSPGSASDSMSDLGQVTSSSVWVAVSSSVK